MALPHFSNYDFLQQISDHPPFQAWRGVNKSTGESCFLKCIAPDGEVSGNGTIGLTLRSLQLQKRLPTSKILKARRHVLQDHHLLVEYPFLDSQRWSPVKPELFLANFPTLLPEICQTLDYLHLQGLVHADVKLEHFLVSTDGRSGASRLVDLDFLSPTNAKPLTKVLGTPEHIAPEILANDVIVCQSDDYSLGIALRQALACSTVATSDCGEEIGPRLTSFANCLCAQNFMQRPVSLLDACLRYGLMTPEVHLQKTRQLLVMVLVTRWRQLVNISKASPLQLGRFIQESCGVYGLHHEFFQCLARWFVRLPRATWLALVSFIEGCELKHMDQYWLVCGSETHLWRFYQLLEPVPEISPESGSETLVAHLLKVARDQASSKSFQRSFLTLRTAAAHLDRSSTEQSNELRSRVRADLARAAGMMNQHQEAYSRLLEVINDPFTLDSARIKLAHDAAMAAVRAGLLGEAGTVLDRVRAALAECPDVEQRLKLERIDGWLMMLRGDFDRAEAILRDALDGADSAGLRELSATLHYMLGVLFWRRGVMGVALVLLREALDSARGEGVASVLIPASAMLAALSAEQASYLPAIRYARYAVSRGASSPEHAASLPAAYLAMVTAFVRLGAFPKAGHWLQRYLGVCTTGAVGDQVLSYLVYRGFLCAQKGALSEADDALYRALAIVMSTSSPVIVGKLHQSLAQIALWRGDADACRTALERARHQFESAHDTASLAELDLIGELNLQIATNRVSSTRLVDLASGMPESQGVYYVAVAVFHSMLLDPHSVPGQLVERVRGALGLRGNRRVPVFAALQELDRYYWQREGGAGSPEVAVWKRAFVHLLKGKQLFLAARTGLKVANLYAIRNQGSHAHKFRTQVIQLAEALPNPQLVEAASTVDAKPGQADDYVHRLSESILGISELVKNVGDFNKTCRRLLQFAVDHTGAERGILFLSPPGSTNLQVGAAINCDDQSVVDVTEFSSQVPWVSVSEASALLIDDAVSDRRTNKFESIVRHNIRSVACVPLYDAGTLQGVLYLDHHAIPALFETADLQFITSVANFLSVVLRAAREFRGLTLANVRLQENLRKSGRSHTLVTVDPTMLDLLGGIPDIASSTASVLLQGESGTGKEIFCELLHAHSRRSMEPLVKLNCAALSQSLLESELFGIARSVATGVAERDGKLAAADGGTLYVDEIGDMPLDVQAKILRAVEYQQFEKVGSNRTIHADIRFIYATNKDLRRLVEDGKFRADLFYRISAIILDIPPLRARRGDIPVLLDHFTTIFGQPGRLPKYSEQAVAVLTSYNWPGNVRELQNFVERACILRAGQPVGLECLPAEMLTPASASVDAEALRAAERASIVKALVKARGNKTKAAHVLGLTPTTFRRKLILYNITYPQ